MKKPHSLIKQLTPEEIEIENKRAELLILEDELTLKELDLATLQVGLEDLRRRYLRIVGVKLAKLDDIEAQIAEILASIEPKNEKIKKQAEQSRAQAKESAEATGSITEEKYEKEPFKPSDNLKQLYRDLAKKVHPDLAPDEKARERRHSFMQKVNKAYAERDEERLQSLINEWENSPDSVAGQGTAAELIRIIRQIALVSARIKAIGKEFNNLKKSELCILKLKIDEAQKDGRDLLLEMAAEVDNKIKDANSRLNEMKKHIETHKQSKKADKMTKESIH